jgi:hypothetical protein
MNIYKFHSNPDELIGYTNRDFYFSDEAKELILQGKEVTKVIGGLYLDGTSITSLPDNLSVGGYLNLQGTSITSLPDNLTVHGDLRLAGTPNLDKDNLPSSLVVKGEICYDWY